MVDQAIPCTLCGLTTYHPLHNEDGLAFCCPACREVSALLAADVGRHSPARAAEAAEMAVATLHLGGMWCPSCSWLIGASLQRAAGVQQAEVHFLQRQARVTYDPARVTRKRLLRQVRRVGYRAWLPGDKPYDDEEGHWNRLLISGVLTMQVMMFSFALYLREWTGRASPDTEWLADIFNWWILLAATPVLLLLGLPILRAGAASLARGRPNIHTLIALGAFSAFGLSLHHLFSGSGRVYFDTAAVLLFLVGVGRWLEMRAQKQSTEVVERLYERLPGEATQITPGGDRQLPLDEVRPGMRLRVRPGQRFPVDGVVASGSGYVDESLLTGEPEPARREGGGGCASGGGRVFAATLSLDGAFEVIAAAVGPETVAGQIGRLLHEALWQRAPVERLADRLAALMTPAAALLAAAAFAFWSWQAGPERGLIVALSVLLIACPCALGLATPLTLWLGLGRAAERGILLRNTAVLEKLAAARALFFDKTGTLTQQPLQLQGVQANGVAPELFAARVAAVERHSEHPLAQAIVTGVGDPAQAPFTTAFRALPGLGVTAEIEGEAVWVGSRRLMQEQGLAFPPHLQQQLAAWQREGWSVVCAGWEGHVQGLLALGERIRPDAAAALAGLQARGYETAVLTGDDAAAGARWQEALQIPVYAEQRPEEKLARLAARPGAIMVGDGINDGPALAAAGVGVAVGQATDVAQAAAEVILLNDDLTSLPWLLDLTRAALRKVRQNLAWAFSYNLIGISLALAGLLQPSIAALFMVASSIIVTTNAHRLKRVPLAGDKT